MEFLQYFIESLNDYSNLLIAFFALGALIVAWHEWRSNRISLRWHMLPVLFPKISVLPEKSVFVLENTSDNPAYDVDLWVIGHYFEEEVPYKSLLSKKYKSEIEISFSDGPYPYESEHYGMVDRVFHPSFPPNSRCEFSLEFKLPPEKIDIVMQFRDSVGNNYLYQCWLLSNEHKKTDQEELRLGHVAFNLRPVKRIKYQYPYPPHFIGWKHFFDIFKHTDHVFLPMRLFRLAPFICEAILTMIRAKLYLEKDIKDTLLRSFPSGYQMVDKDITIEGRGTFTRI